MPQTKEGQRNQTEERMLGLHLHKAKKTKNGWGAKASPGVGVGTVGPSSSELLAPGGRSLHPSMTKALLGAGTSLGSGTWQVEEAAATAGRTGAAGLSCLGWACRGWAGEASSRPSQAPRLSPALWLQVESRTPIPMLKPSPQCYCSLDGALMEAIKVK